MNDYGIFSPAYPIELLSRQTFQPDHQALKEALGRRLGLVDIPDDAGPGKPFLFFLRDYPVEFEDATVPAQLALFNTDKPVDPARYQEPLQQSWDIDKAAAVLERCHYSMALANMMSSSLPQQIRREIVAGALLALTELLEVDLIYWTPTEQLVDPVKFAARLNEPGHIANPTYGFVNVRFYNIEGTDGDIVMDTLGLGALGLTDLQMHYRDLAPGEVAAKLYNTAVYLFENGDVIESGHTVQGLKPADQWPCQHETSLLPPERIVLDINPGPPFAAGGRK